MNHLLIGTNDKTDWLLHHAKPGFLLIDDGPIADAFLKHFPKAREFDLTQHSFNPLRGMDYRAKAAFVSIMLEAFPGGQGTLTKEGVPLAFFDELARNPDYLSDLFLEKSQDTSYLSAQRMMKRILHSPVLTRVLCQRTNFSFKGSIVARINPAELGEFDALLLAWLLMAQHKRQVIVPDGGRYLRPLHMSLIDQDRLTCGVKYLSQLGPEDGVLRQAVLGIKDKTGSGCTFKDACALANYEGVIPGTNFHANYVGELMGHKPTEDRFS